MDENQVYTATFTLLTRYFYYRNVTGEDVQDLLQEIYIVFFTKYDCSGMDETAVTKVLYTIAHNKYREWVRERVNRPVYELDQEIPVSDTYEEFIEESDPEFSEDDKEVLKQAISELNPTMQSVINLRFINNLSRKEVAEALGISESDVHTYQKRAIKMLREKLVVVPPLA